MWLIIVFMIGVKAFGLRSFGPVRRQALQTVCSGSVHNPRITSMACSTYSSSDHNMGMPDEGDRGLNNENGEDDEEGFDASATASWAVLTPSSAPRWTGSPLRPLAP